MLHRAGIRPSKASCVVGALGCTAFTAIGVAMCLWIDDQPVRIFLFIWTGLAASGMVLNVVHAFTDATPFGAEVVFDDKVLRQSDPEQRLRRLEQLKAQGLLSDEEYDRKRREILRQL